MANPNGNNGRPKKPKKQAEVAVERTMSEQSKFTPEVCAAIVKASSQGMTKELCAAMAGISYRTLRRWELRGMEDPAGPVHDFVDDWHRAHAKFINAHLLNVTKAAVGTPPTVKDGKVVPGIEGDWRASIELLARIRPDQFGRRVVEVGGHDGGPIQVDVSDARERLMESITRGLEAVDGNGPA